MFAQVALDAVLLFTLAVLMATMQPAPLLTKVGVGLITLIAVSMEFLAVISLREFWRVSPQIYRWLPTAEDSDYLRQRLRKQIFKEHEVGTQEGVNNPQGKRYRIFSSIPDARIAQIFESSLNKVGHHKVDRDDADINLLVATNFTSAEIIDEAMNARGVFIPILVMSVQELNLPSKLLEHQWLDFRDFSVARIAKFADLMADSQKRNLLLIDPNFKANVGKGNSFYYLNIMIQALGIGYLVWSVLNSLVITGFVHHIPLLERMGYLTFVPLTLAWTVGILLCWLSSLVPYRHIRLQWCRRLCYALTLSALYLTITSSQLFFPLMSFAVLLFISYYHYRFDPGWYPAVLPSKTFLIHRPASILHILKLILFAVAICVGMFLLESAT